MKVQVPGKIVLLGEWAVLDGAPAICSAVDKFFWGEITSTKPELERNRVHAQMMGIDENGEIKETEGSWEASKSEKRQHADDFVRRFQQVCSLLDATHQWPPSSLKLYRGWKLSEGFGSSSASLLAMLALHEQISGRLKLNSQGEIENKGAFFLTAQKIYHDLEGGRGSGIDLATQIYGGTLVFQRNEIPRPYGGLLPVQLKIIHTGNKVITREVLKTQPVSSESKSALGNSIKKFLNCMNWQVAIEEHSQILSQCQIVPPEIQETCERLKKRGLVSAIKTTGAGGGDALLAFVMPEKESALREYVDQAGFWVSDAQWGAPGLRVDSTLRLPEKMSP
jgi:phosphomevalonate kinase